MRRQPPRSPLFPYTALFRPPGQSNIAVVRGHRAATADRDLAGVAVREVEVRGAGREAEQDRKSTRLNSSHANISYAVFCLKKKKSNTKIAYTFFCVNQRHI